MRAIEREEFVEVVCDVCTDQGATATDLSERLLAVICQHQAAIGLSKLEWIELCSTAWAICETDRASLENPS